MSMWQKIKSIQIPGTIWSPLLVGAMLGTTMVLFTKLPTAPRGVHTLDANTFGKNESLDLTIKLESGEELHLKATGATTMDLVQSCLLYTSPSPRDATLSRMPSSA